MQDFFTIQEDDMMNRLFYPTIRASSLKRLKCFDKIDVDENEPDSRIFVQTPIFFDHYIRFQMDNFLRIPNIMIYSADKDERIDWMSEIKFSWRGKKYFYFFTNWTVSAAGELLRQVQQMKKPYLYEHFRNGLQYRCYERHLELYRERYRLYLENGIGHAISFQVKTIDDIQEHYGYTWPPNDDLSFEFFCGKCDNLEYCCQCSAYSKCKLRNPDSSIGFLEKCCRKQRLIRGEKNYKIIYFDYENRPLPSSRYFARKDHVFKLIPNVKFSHVENQLDWGL